MLILVKNIKTTLALVKILIVLDFGQKFTEISNLVKIYQNVDFRQNCRNVDYSENFQKCRSGSKFANTSNLVKVFQKARFSLKFSKISTSVKIVKIVKENIDFIRNVQKD